VVTRRRTRSTARSKTSTRSSLRPADPRRCSVIRRPRPWPRLSNRGSCAIPSRPAGHSTHAHLRRDHHRRPVAAVRAALLGRHADTRDRRRTVLAVDARRGASRHGHAPQRTALLTRRSDAQHRAGRHSARAGGFPRRRTCSDSRTPPQARNECVVASRGWAVRCSLIAGRILTSQQRSKTRETVSWEQTRGRPGQPS
jgi:hypothetical protein